MPIWSSFFNRVDSKTKHRKRFKTTRTVCRTEWDHIFICSAEHFFYKSSTNRIWCSDPYAHKDTYIHWGQHWKCFRGWEWVLTRIGHADTSADAHHPHEPHIPHMSEYSAHMLDLRIFRNRMANPSFDTRDRYRFKRNSVVDIERPRFFYIILEHLCKVVVNRLEWRPLMFPDKRETNPRLRRWHFSHFYGPFTAFLLPYQCCCTIWW